MSQLDRLPPVLAEQFKLLEGIRLVKGTLNPQQVRAAVHEYLKWAPGLDQTAQFPYLHWLHAFMIFGAAPDQTFLPEVSLFTDYVLGRHLERADFEMVYAVAQILDSSKPIHLIHHHSCYAPLGTHHKAYTPVVGQLCLVAFPSLQEGVYAGCVPIQSKPDGWILLLQGLGEVFIPTLNSFYQPYNDAFDQRLWRLQLQPGSIIDAKTKNGVWYQSTIIKRNIQKLIVGFRTYFPGQLGYEGLDQQHDQQIHLFSRRVQPRDLIKLKQVTNEQQRAMDDTEDALSLPMIVREDGLAVIRNGRGSQLVKRLNQFYRRKGFDTLLHQMRNPQFPQNLFITSIGLFIKNWPFFHRSKLALYQSQVVILIKTFLLDKNKPKTLGVHANVEWLLKNIDFILRRTKTRKAKDVYISVLAREVSLLLLGENALDRTISGIKILTDLLQQVSWSKEVTEGMKKWIEERRIFEKVYNPMTHHQVLSRSQPFLDYLLGHSLLGVSNARQLWETTLKIDEHSSNTLLKTISECAKSMDSTILNYFVSQLLALPHLKISQPCLDLLCNLAKQTEKSQAFIMNVAEYLTNTATSANKHKRKAAELLVKVGGLLQIGQRVKLVNRFLNNFERQLFETMTKIVTETKQQQMQNFCIGLLFQMDLERLLQVLKSKCELGLLQFLAAIYRGAKAVIPIQMISQKLGYLQDFIVWLAAEPCVPNQVKRRVAFPEVWPIQCGKFTEQGIKALITIFKEFNAESGSIQIYQFPVNLQLFESQSKAKPGKVTVEQRSLILTKVSSLAELKGFHHLLNTMLRSKNDKQLRLFLTKLFRFPHPDYVQQNINLVKELICSGPAVLRSFLQQDNTVQLARQKGQNYLSFISKLLELTELEGTGGLQPYSWFLPRNKYSFKVVNQMNGEVSQVQQFDSVSSVWQLKQRISQIVRQPACSLNFKTGLTSLKDCKNSHTLDQAFLALSSTITIQKIFLNLELKKQFAELNCSRIDHQSLVKYLEGQKLPTIFARWADPSLGCQSFVNFMCNFYYQKPFLLNGVFGRKYLSQLGAQASYLQLLDTSQACPFANDVTNFVLRLGPHVPLLNQIKADPNLVFRLGPASRLYSLPLLVSVLQQNGFRGIDWTQLFAMAEDYLLSKPTERPQSQLTQILVLLDMISDSLIAFASAEYLVESNSQQRLRKYKQVYQPLRTQQSSRLPLKQALLATNLFDITIRAQVSLIQCTRSLQVGKFYTALCRLMAVSCRTTKVQLGQYRFQFIRLLNSQNVVGRQKFAKAFRHLANIELILSLLQEQKQPSYYEGIYNMLAECIMHMDCEGKKAEQAFKRSVKGLFQSGKHQQALGSWLLVIKTLVPMVQISREFIKSLIQYLLLNCLFDLKQRSLQTYLAAAQLIRQSNQFYLLKFPLKKPENRKTCCQIVVMLLEREPLQVELVANSLLTLGNSSKTVKRKLVEKGAAVGIQNLGCICYLSAMIQVFAKVHQFRGAVLALAEIEGDRPQVVQLSRLFHFLSFSIRNQYNPESFLNSFKPPISPQVQQDTGEFLVYLFDLLEKQAAGTPYATFLQQVFGGSTVTQMICGGCKAVRSVEQTFYSYGVSVKGRESLDEAILGMQQGQILSDCYCQSCSSKHDTLRRTVIRKLPNYFLISLQRIIFDIDSLRNVKIHTRLTFPDQLNAYPYTQNSTAGEAPPGFKFSLSGIIVHSGRAEHGHYYAYLKRDSSWYKLDDSRCSKQNPLTFLKQCYGGSVNPSQWGMLGETSANAYVLLYQKEHKDSLPEVGDFSARTCSQVYYDNDRFLRSYYTLSKPHEYYFEFALRVFELRAASEPVKTRLLVNFYLTNLVCKIEGVAAYASKFSKLSADIMEKYQLVQHFQIFQEATPATLMQYESAFRLPFADLLVRQIRYIVSSPKLVYFINTAIAKVQQIYSSFLTKQPNVKSDVIFRLLLGIADLEQARNFIIQGDTVCNVISYFKDKVKCQFKDGVAFIRKAVEGRALTSKQQAALFDQKLFAQLYKQKVHPEQTVRLHCHLCVLRPELNTQIAEMILGGMESGSWEEVDLYFQLARQFLRIQDQHLVQRIQMVLGVPQWALCSPRLHDSPVVKYLSSRLTSKHKCLFAHLAAGRDNVGFTLKLIEILLDLSETVSQIKFYLKNNSGVSVREPSLLSWVPKYLAQKVATLNANRTELKGFDHNAAFKKAQAWFEANQVAPFPFVLGRYLGQCQHQTYQSQGVQFRVQNHAVSFSRDTNKIALLDFSKLGQLTRQTHLRELFDCPQSEGGYHPQLLVQKDKVLSYLILINKDNSLANVRLTKISQKISCACSYSLSLQPGASATISYFVNDPSARTSFTTQFKVQISKSKPSAAPKTPAAFIECKVCTCHNPPTAKTCEACDSSLANA